jgi:hypothetical protein
MSSIDQAMERDNLVAAAIGTAEEICDPLEDLVEKTTADPGAPFVPCANSTPTRTRCCSTRPGQ